MAIAIAIATAAAAATAFTGSLFRFGLGSGFFGRFFVSEFPDSTLMKTTWRTEISHKNVN